MYIYKQLITMLYEIKNIFLDKTKIKEHELAVALKLNKLMLNERKNRKISKYTKEKFNKDNVLTFYSLAKYYNLATISELSLLYIERCFPMVVGTQNFLHLCFNFVTKVLKSSKLNIHSEVEIVYAVITWLKYNSKERSKYAKQLLLKVVRFNLISEDALKQISNCCLMLTKNIECGKLFKEILLNQKNCYSARTDKCYTSRYCSQNKFSIVLCGGNKGLREVYQVNKNNLNNIISLTPMTKGRRNSEAVSSKGNLYVFGGYNSCGSWVRTIEKYSPSTKIWTTITEMLDDRNRFCACAFMDEIFTFGGVCNKNNYVTNSCLQFDTKQENWSNKSFKGLARMKDTRYLAACVVFQGNIVVSGGINNNNNDLNSVESYDVFANKWSTMPNMINDKSLHDLAVVKDKLFVIGYGTDICEVFDNISKTFVSLKQPYCSLMLNKALSIGNRIYVFEENRSTVVFYDVDGNSWSEQPCGLTGGLQAFSCANLPCY